MLRDTFSKVFAADWSKLHVHAASRCAVAIAAALTVGVSSGSPRRGVVAAAGAFSVGFGSFHRMRGSRARPMLLAALGMCVASWAGTLAGNSPVATVLMAAAAAFAYGVISSKSKGASWVALQCAIWLVISTAYPAHGLEALGRGSLILAGGLLQILVSAIWWRLAFVEDRDESGGAAPVESASRIFAVRAAVTIALAAALERALTAQNSYWIPMTALIVLRPGLGETIERGLARIAGTVVGAVLATAILKLAAPGNWITAAGVVMFAWSSYALFYVNYAYFAVSLTAYVVFLLSLAGVDRQPLIAHRVLFTLIGGALAWATRWTAELLDRWAGNRRA